MHQPNEHGASAPSHAHAHVHENKKLVADRLARAAGHLEKVRRMVNDDCDCSEVLLQLAAVRGALDKAGRILLQDHLRHCIVEAVQADDQGAIEALCEAIDKLMK